MVKSPFAVLTALPAAPAGVSFTFTVAPATGFPSGSMTVPVTAPPACANTLDASNHRTGKSARHLFIRAFSANHTPDLSRLPVNDNFRPLGKLQQLGRKGEGRWPTWFEFGVLRRYFNSLSSLSYLGPPRSSFCLGKDRKSVV